MHWVTCKKTFHLNSCRYSWWWSLWSAQWIKLSAVATLAGPPASLWQNFTSAGRVKILLTNQQTAPFQAPPPFSTSGIFGVEKVGIFPTATNHPRFLKRLVQAWIWFYHSPPSKSIFGQRWGKLDKAEVRAISNHHNGGGWYQKWFSIVLPLCVSW